jgi:hypothetical protein
VLSSMVMNACVQGLKNSGDLRSLDIDCRGDMLRTFHKNYGFAE